MTRDAEQSAVRDLLEKPPRASVSFTDGAAVDLLPVRARCSAERYWFGVPVYASPNFKDREVVLVIDDGP